MYAIDIMDTKKADWKMNQTEILRVILKLKI